MSRSLARVPTAGVGAGSAGISTMRRSGLGAVMPAA